MLTPFYVSFLGFSPSCFACHRASLTPSTENSRRDHGVPLPLRTVLHVSFLLCLGQPPAIQHRFKGSLLNLLVRTDLKTTRVLPASVDLHFLSLHLHCLLLALCGVPTLKPQVTSDFSPVQPQTCTVLALPRWHRSILDKPWCQCQACPESGCGVVTACSSLPQSDCREPL